MSSGFKLTIFNATLFEHLNRGFDFYVFACVVEIVEVNDFSNASLDDGLGTFNAREVVDVDAGGLELAHIAAEIKNGVKLGMTDVRVFSIERRAFAIPREIIVVETIRCAVIADGEDAII